MKLFRIKLLILIIFLTPFITYGMGNKDIIYEWPSALPDRFDPIEFGNRVRSIIISSIYDTLYDYKYLEVPLGIKPRLAEELPHFSSDQLKVKITIKNGVFFASDKSFPKGKGREIVAEDFVFSVKRLLLKKGSSSFVNKLLDNIKGIEKWKSKHKFEEKIEGLKTIDSHTIELNLSAPVSNLVNILASSAFSIVPREAVEFYGSKFGQNPVGSGPFKLKEANTKNTVLVKNDSYREERFNLVYEGFNKLAHSGFGLEALNGKKMPFVDSVTMSSESDGFVRLENLQGEESNYMTVVVQRHLKGIDHLIDPAKFRGSWREKINLLESLTSSLFYMLFNMSDNEIGHNKNPERDEFNRILRLAIRSSIDWENLFDVNGESPYEIFPGVIPPNIQGYDRSVSFDYVNQNVVEAKQSISKLKSTGKKLPKLKIGIIVDGLTQPEHFQKTLKQGIKLIGYPSELIEFKKYKGLSSYIDAFRNNEFNFAATMWWFFGYPDAENILQLFSGSGFPNESRFSSAEYDQVFKEIRLTPHSPKRSELIKRANEILFRDCPVISGGSERAIHAWRKNIIAYPRHGVIGSFFKYIDLDLSVPKENLKKPKGGAKK